MRKNNYIILLVLICTFLVGCKEDQQSSSANVNNLGQGQLVINLTDAPFPFESLKEAVVTISKIEIHRKAGDLSGFSVISEEEQTYNLLNLRGGTTEMLVSLDLPAGTYNQIRMIVSKAYVILKNDVRFDLNIPSGAQTGIKMNINPFLEIKTGLSNELTLDFDVAKSFIPQGNPNSANGITGFTFTPVLRVANESVHGRITGSVLSDSCTSSNSLDDLALDNTTIFAVQNGETIAMTGTNTDGDFALIGLKAGMYNILIEKNHYESMSIQNIEVFVANEFPLDTSTLTAKCGTISGFISSDAGTSAINDDPPLADAAVNLIEDGSIIAEVFSDAIDGSFYFPEMLEGAYQIEVLEDGHGSKLLDAPVTHNFDTQFDILLNQL